MFDLFGIPSLIKSAVWASALVYLKPAIMLASLAGIVISMAYAGGKIMSFFTKILENKIGRWALGLSAVFLIGAGAGWYVHPDGDHVKKVGVKYEPLKLRSYAIKFDGKTYYPTEFINRVIHDQGLDKSFKPMINFENDQLKIAVKEDTGRGFLIEKDANKVYSVIEIFDLNESFEMNMKGDAQEMKRGCHKGGGHSHHHHHHIWHGGGCYPGPYWNPWGYPGCPGIYGGGGDLNLIIRI